MSVVRGYVPQAVSWSPDGARLCRVDTWSIVTRADELKTESNISLSNLHLIKGFEIGCGPSYVSDLMYRRRGTIHRPQPFNTLFVTSTNDHISNSLQDGLLLKRWPLISKDIPSSRPKINAFQFNPLGLAVVNFKVNSYQIRIFECATTYDTHSNLDKRSSENY